jgi:hypothetical protein
VVQRKNKTGEEWARKYLRTSYTPEVSLKNVHTDGLFNEIITSPTACQYLVDGSQNFHASRSVKNRG